MLQDLLQMVTGANKATQVSEKTKDRFVVKNTGEGSVRYENEATQISISIFKFSLYRLTSACARGALQRLEAHMAVGRLKKELFEHAQQM